MHASPQDRRIAVVVIHGIGFQQPFETLDKVADGVVHAAKTVFGYEKTEVAVREFEQHHVTPRAGYTSDFWERNYFEVTAPPPNADAPTWRFTLLEAYWGHRRDTTLPPAKARRWVVQRLKELQRAELYSCARGPVEENEGNQTRLRLIDPQDPQDRGRVGEGDRKIGWWKRAALRLFLLALGVAGPFSGIVGQIGGAVSRAALSVVRWQDVVAYITTDPQNPLYRVRGEILDEVEERLEAIADWAADPTAEVDAVVVVAHSLGSVILVDTINRMRRRPAGRHALGRLQPRTVLVTLGSPIDHILRLVLFRMNPENPFRNTTTLRRVAWRLRQHLRAIDDAADIGGVKQDLADDLFCGVPLLNFYAYADPISSEITTLTEVENIACNYGNGLDGHLRYWGDHQVYRAVFTAVRDRLIERGLSVA